MKIDWFFCIPWWIHEVDWFIDLWRIEDIWAACEKGNTSAPASGQLDLHRTAPKCLRKKATRTSRRLWAHLLQKLGPMLRQVQDLSTEQQNTQRATDTKKRNRQTQEHVQEGKRTQDSTFRYIILLAHATSSAVTRKSLATTTKNNGKKEQVTVRTTKRTAPTTSKQNNANEIQSGLGGHQHRLGLKETHRPSRCTSQPSATDSTERAKSGHCVDRPTSLASEKETRAKLETTRAHTNIYIYIYIYI